MGRGERGERGGGKGREGGSEMKTKVENLRDGFWLDGN